MYHEHGQGNVHLVVVDENVHLTGVGSHVEQQADQLGRGDDARKHRDRGVDENVLYERRPAYKGPTKRWGVG